MFDAWVRALKDRLIAPLATWLGRFVHPHLVTVSALLAGLMTAWLAAMGGTVSAFGWWVVSRLLDGLDGSVARASGRQSDFGGYLDILLDFIVYAAVPLGIVAANPAAAPAGLFLLATFVVNSASWMYLSAILERRGQGAATTGERTTVTMPPGIIAGAETVVFYSLFLLMPQHAPTLFTVMGLLVVGNVVQRLVWAARRL